MVTIISEGIIQGLNIYIKRIPNIENRVIDIFGKSDHFYSFLIYKIRIFKISTQTRSRYFLLDYFSFSITISTLFYIKLSIKHTTNIFYIIKNSTTISEGIIQGLNIYIKRIPNIENRVIDIFGKSENIRNLINMIVECNNRTLFRPLSPFNPFRIFFNSSLS